MFVLRQTIVSILPAWQFIEASVNTATAKSYLMIWWNSETAVVVPRLRLCFTLYITGQATDSCRQVV